VKTESTAIWHQKINLHQVGKEFELKHSSNRRFCRFMFYCGNTIDEVIAHLQAQHIEIIEGPIERTGAMENFDLFS
jgi:hypothetical protein